MTRAVHLYASDVSALADAALFDAALQRASAQRREAVLRFRREEDRMRSLGAFLLLRTALHENGYAAMRMDFSFGENGKPFLPFLPSVQFNLSHSGQYALCAISDCPVGCDVEKIKHADLRIAHRFFHPEECRALMDETSEEERNRKFYEFWSLKESFLKATGLGLSLPMDRFEIRMGPPVACLWDEGKRVFHLETLSELPGYSCALCAEADRAIIQFHLIHPEAFLKLPELD